MVKKTETTHVEYSIIDNDHDSNNKLDCGNCKIAYDNNTVGSSTVTFKFNDSIQYE